MSLTLKATVYCAKGHLKHRLARIGAVCVLSAVLGLSSAAALAQAPTYRVVQQWTTADGLPTETLNGVTIDHQGELWLATHDGVVRYQGFDFSIYNRSTTPALPSNRLDKVFTMPKNGVVVRFEGDLLGHLSDQGFAPIGVANRERVVVFQGQLWFIDDDSGRLHSWDEHAGLTTHTEPDQVLTALAVDPYADRLLLGTANGQVLSLTAPDQPATELHPAYGTPVMGLAANADGELFIVDALHSHVLRPGEALHTLTTWELPQTTAVSSAWTEQGWLMANLISLQGTLPHLITSSGLQLVDFYEPLSLDASRIPLRIQHIDDQGRHWINTGVSLYRDGERVFSNGERILSFAVDAFDQVWITQPLQGLQLLNRTVVSHFGADLIGLPDPNITLVTRLGDDILVGSWVSLSHLDTATGTWTRWLDRAALDVLRDDDGRLLVASHGLCWLEHRNHCVPVDDFPSPGSRVRMLHRDGRGALWAGSDDGLYRRSPEGAWAAQVVHPAAVRTALEDAAGRLVFGTRGDGLLVVEAGSAHTAPRVIGVEDGLSSGFVRALLRLDDGGLLVGTEDAGLCLLDAELVVMNCLSSERGLPHHSAHFLLVDADGRLWVNTNSGVYHVDLAELLSFLKGDTTTGPNFVRLGTRDGLPSMEGNGGVYRAGAMTDDGRIWFPNQLGLVAIESQLGMTQANRPLTPEIRILNGETDHYHHLDRPIHLARDARHLDLELVAVALANPDNVEFRYRLGQHANWQTIGRQRTLILRQLPPGSHRLEVAARYVGEEWTGPVAALDFTAGYYPHEHPLLQALLLGLMVLAGAGVWRRMQRKQQRLASWAEERSVQLGEATKQVSQLTGALQRVDLKHQTALQAVGHEIKLTLNTILAPLVQQPNNPLPAQQTQTMRLQVETLQSLMGQLEHYQAPTAPPLTASPNRGELDGTPDAPSANAASPTAGMAADLERRVRMALLLHLGDPDFSVDDLAARLGMSRSALYRGMDEACGIGPAELLRELRLEQATRLLQESNKQISSIADATGFRNVAAFSRAFTKKMGLSPRQWRDRMARQSDDAD